MTAHFVILHLVIDGVRVTGFAAKVSARMGQSPWFGAPQHMGWAPGALPGSAVKQQHGHTASSHLRTFYPWDGSTLTQEHMETPREAGLGGCLAPIGANHSFQGWVIQILGLKPLRWEDSQARAAPGIQLSLSQFGNFILGFYKGQG